MVTITIKTVQKVEVKHLIVSAGFRYWEGVIINGVEDTNGTLTPLRKGGCWNPTIDIETGTIVNWPPGIVASLNCKVCDSGVYQLADKGGNIVKEIKGYVPKIMCPEGEGYGDYIIMKIDTTGKIDKWKIVLSEFES